MVFAPKFRVLCRRWNLPFLHQWQFREMCTNPKRLYVWYLMLLANISSDHHCVVAKQFPYIPWFQSGQFTMAFVSEIVSLVGFGLFYFMSEFPLFARRFVTQLNRK